MYDRQHLRVTRLANLLRRRTERRHRLAKFPSHKLRLATLERLALGTRSRPGRDHHRQTHA